MDRKAAHKIIYESAKLYNEHLHNNNYLIVYKSKSIDVEHQYIEIIFNSHNFSHLTGVVLNGITSEVFYDRIVNNKLSLKDYSFKKDGTTILKLNVIQALMKFPNKFSMIGDFSGNGFKLKTEKLIGNISGAIGFVKQKNNNFYIPNTLLNCDIRDYIVDSQQIKAIYKKHKKDKNYCIEPVYISKDLKNIEKMEWSNIEITKKLID